MSQPIFVVTGSCQGIEISLDSDSVPFGAVVLGSRSTRKLIMHNTGDIGAAFNWNIEKFQPDFSISPVKGYISPGMEVSFEILFHPTVVNHDMRYEVSFLSASENSDYCLELGIGRIKEFINLSAGGQLFSRAGKVKLNFFIRKTFLYMIKPGGQNHPHSVSICPVPIP